MARDIEEFLRKAAERRAQAQRAANQARGGQPPQAGNLPPRQPDLVIGADVIGPDIVEPEVVITSGRGRVGDHQVGTRTPELKSKVENANQKLDARLHETFDHSLGSLRSDNATQNRSADTAGPDADLPADEILKLLSNPQSIRAAILLSEILDRPTHRW